MATIIFVRRYEYYNETIYEVKYNSGRLYTYIDKAPKKVAAFMESKTPREQWNGMNRWEYIYE